MSTGPSRARGRAQPGEEAPFFFEGIESPNGTIFPDALLDLVMPFLTPTEWKVCSYVVRRTFGWKKASDRISLEQICHGIVRRDGSRLDYGTQLDRKTAIKALRGLEAKGVIVAQRNYSAAHGYEPTTYGLRFRGQQPTRTLGEKLPQGDGPQVEEFPQGEDDALHRPPVDSLHQASGTPPPALVEDLDRQRTASQSNTLTSGTDRKKTNRRQAGPGDSGVPASVAVKHARELRAPEMPEEQPPRDTTTRPGERETGLAADPPPHLAGPVGDVALWAAVLARLRQQMTAANYQTWLAETRPLGRRGPTLVVGAPSGFVRDWLQTRFRLLVRRALQDAGAAVDDVTFEVFDC